MEEEVAGDLQADSEESCREDPKGRGMADWTGKQPRQLLSDRLFPL